MGGFKVHARSGRPKTVPEEHYGFIDTEMAKNDKLTATDLEQLLLDKFGRNAVKYSLCTLARARKDLGWTFSTARYCQAIKRAISLRD